MKRKGLAAACAEKVGKCRSMRALITARAAAGLAEEQVAASMGAANSALSA